MILYNDDDSGSCHDQCTIHESFPNNLTVNLPVYLVENPKKKKTWVGKLFAIWNPLLNNVP